MWATRRRNILRLFLKPQQINVNEMLNPVKCLARSIIFITLYNVKQNKDMESISIILIAALMLYTAEKTKKYRKL